jgi:preprotein translocase subunit SecY
LAVIQGYAISSWLMNSQHNGMPLVASPYVSFIPFQIMTIITLCAGTCFIMWLGEQITDRGIGDGVSMIIFAGIAAGIPAGAANLWGLVQSQELHILIALGLLAFMIVVVAAIIFLEVGERRIPIHSTQKGARQMPVQASHLPMKINLSGVIPPIFASSLLLFPATMAQFIQKPWVAAIRDSLTPTGTLYNIMFVGLIVFFCFFYVDIVMNPDEMADNLKKGQKFVPGIRAGSSTSQYLRKVMDRINVGGAIYLSAICILPTMLISELKVPFYFGGTSLLILVGVALQTTRQISSIVMTQRYESWMKGARVRSRRVQF